VKTKGDLTNVKSVEDTLKEMSSLSQIAKAQVVKAQQQQLKYANKKRRDHTFQIGDQVLLSTEHLHQDTQSRRPTKKLAHQYIGPFEIMGQVNSVTFTLDLGEALKIHNAFHVSLLKPYRRNQEHLFPNRYIPPPPPVLVDGQEHYHVERILDHRDRRGKRTYLVKWEGYHETDATWEPAETMRGDAPAIVEQYWDSVDELDRARAIRYAEAYGNM
jgi:hypothetical protein